MTLTGPPAATGTGRAATAAPAAAPVTEAVPDVARTPRLRRRFGLLALLFVGFFAFTVVVLGLGVVTAVAARNASIHERLHDWGVEETLWGRLAEGMGDAAHRSEDGWQLALDYGFSLLNLSLALFLYRLRPNDRTAPLLAFGLVGTAAVFNLQADLVYQTLDPGPLESLTHDGYHVVAALAYVFALLIFPDGRLVPRWRRGPLALLYLAVIPPLAGLAYTVQGGESRTAGLVTLFGVVTPVAGVAAQAYRYRRHAHALERQQSRLLFWALSPALLVGVYALVYALGTRDPGFEGRGIIELPVALFRVFQPVFLIIPIALLIGIFRFRLWDVDKVISRALVYGLLAGFVSALYIAVVVGLGSLVGRRQEGDLGLSIAATFLVAVTFAPVKERVQRLANRLVYGQRATPYEVLSEFSERVGESVPTDELLGRMARLLAEGTGASRADVWLKVGDDLRPTAAWTTAAWTGGSFPDPVPQVVTGDQVPALPGATRAVAVRHQGELFGALSVVKPGAEGLSPTEEKLLADLAGQAGLVFRNLRLTAELLERLEELKASRQRLVTAQDDARRRLERNLHDGAQQQLVALKVHLSLAEDLADELGPPGQQLTELLGQLKAHTGAALEELRDLARGIFPPLLAAEGLPSALASQARKSAVPATVSAPGVGRYAESVEAAVYFCCLEALQNVAKYAQASQVEILLEQVGGVLRFIVADDGVGFDPALAAHGAGTVNMRDRVESLDGRVRWETAPGRGTRVIGEIPVAAPTGPTGPTG